MNHQLEVKKSIEITASLMDVWNALTDRETIKKYFFGTEAISDWEEGSSLLFRGAWEGKSYEDKGTILEAIPGEMLKYDYWSGFSGLEDKPENYSVVTYTLEQAVDGTILYLKQKGFAGEEAKAHSEQGWTMVLKNLKELLESQ
jgi:uncharacterized protein YndB with AHSA1/START domain